MSQVSFGMILRDARERKGYDVATVARRLRIRPDILQAIEASDFSRMPPRGYTRNMVNAYARFLGLNPTEMTHMYLDECYAYQVGRARSNSRSTGIDMSDAPGSKRSSRRKPEGEDFGSEGTGTFGRALYTDRRSAERMDDIPERSSQGHADDRAHRSNRSAVPTTQYTNFYSGPQAAAGVRSKLPFIIGGVVILILVIVIVFLMVNNGKGDEEQTPNVPVTGVENNGNDTTGGDNTPQNDTPTPTPTEPEEFEVEVVLGDNAKNVWLEFYEEDSSNPRKLNASYDGPQTEKITSSGNVKFICGDASADVKVYINGEEQQLESKSGTYNETFKFSDYLEDWKKENNVTSDGQSGDSGGSDSGSTDS